MALKVVILPGEEKLFSRVIDGIPGIGTIGKEIFLVRSIVLTGFGISGILFSHTILELSVKLSF
jgi:hypothetical protein